MRHYWTDADEAALLRAVEQTGAAREAYEAEGAAGDTLWALVAGALAAGGGPTVTPGAARVRHGEIRRRTADRDRWCPACEAVRLSRWQPSPDAGPHWRCSECGGVTEHRPPGYASNAMHADLAHEFVDTKGGPTKFQVFANPRLAEEWDADSGDQGLAARVEDWAVPEDGWERAEALAEPDAVDELAALRAVVQTAAEDARLVRRMVEEICQQLGVDVSRWALARWTADGRDEDARRAFEGGPT